MPNFPPPLTPVDHSVVAWTDPETSLNWLWSVRGTGGKWKSIGVVTIPPHGHPAFTWMNEDLTIPENITIDGLGDPIVVPQTGVVLSLPVYTDDVWAISFNEDDGYWQIVNLIAGGGYMSEVTTVTNPMDVTTWTPVSPSTDPITLTGDAPADGTFIGERLRAGYGGSYVWFSWTDSGWSGDGGGRSGVDLTPYALKTNETHTNSTLAGTLTSGSLTTDATTKTNLRNALGLGTGDGPEFGGVNGATIGAYTGGFTGSLRTETIFGAGAWYPAGWGYNTCIGYEAGVLGYYSGNATCIGAHSNAGISGTAVGYGSTVNSGGVAVGCGTRAELRADTNGVALGTGATAGVNAIAIGYGTVAAANTAVIGNASTTSTVLKGSVLSYNTFTDNSNYERAFFKWNSDVFKIGVEVAGTGVERPVRIDHLGINSNNSMGDDRLSVEGGGVYSEYLVLKNWGEYPTVGNLGYRPGALFALWSDLWFDNNSGYCQVFHSGKNIGWSNYAVIARSGNSYIGIYSTTDYFGIGTTAPTEKLEVVGNIKSSGTVYADSVVAASVTVADVGNVVVVITGATSPVNYAGTYLPAGTYNGKNYYVSGANYLWADANNWWRLSSALGASDGFPHWYAHSASDTLPPETSLWTEYGGVSTGTMTSIIGPASPTMLATSSGQVIIGSLVGNGKLSVKGNGTGTGVLAQFADSTDAAKITVLDNGSVGLGTTTPEATLDVRGGALIVGGLTLRDSDDSLGAVGISAGEGVFDSYCNFQTRQWGCDYTWGSNGYVYMHLHESYNSTTFLELFDLAHVSKIKLNVDGDSYFRGGSVTAPQFIEGHTELGTVVSTATITITGGTCVTAKLTSSTPCVFTMPTAGPGLSFVLHLKQAATPTTATFTDVIWSGGTAPVITATAGKMDILSFVTGPNAAGDGWLWYGSFIQNLTPT